MWILRKLLSLCGCCSRMRCARLGVELGIPEHLGVPAAVPGGRALGIRIIGEVTAEKVQHRAGRGR